jgi:hypothetical protein
VTGKDLVVFSDQNRIGKAKLPNAVSDLPYLFLGVGASIIWIRA